MNDTLLMAKLREKGHTVKTISKEIGITPTTFHKKKSWKYKPEFTIKEANKILHELELSDEEILRIFFDKKLA